MKALLLFAFLALAPQAHAGQQYKDNCRYLRSVSRLPELADTKQGREVSREMRLAYRVLCRLKYSDGATVRYPNGQTATISYNSDGYNMYYSNGQTMTSGSSYSTWYYPNGQTISSAMSKGYTVYHFNGQTATSGWMSRGYTWYYPNGQTITSSAGSRGYTWYYPNGQTISSGFGTAGYTWYYENGQTMTSSGPELSEDELLDVPSALSLVRE